MEQKELTSDQLVYQAFLERFRDAEVAATVRVIHSRIYKTVVFMDAEVLEIAFTENSLNDDDELQILVGRVVQVEMVHDKVQGMQVDSTFANTEFHRNLLRNSAHSFVVGKLCSDRKAQGNIIVSKPVIARRVSYLSRQWVEYVLNHLESISSDSLSDSYISEGAQMLGIDSPRLLKLLESRKISRDESVSKEEKHPHVQHSRQESMKILKILRGIDENYIPNRAYKLSADEISLLQQTIDQLAVRNVLIPLADPIFHEFPEEYVYRKNSELHRVPGLPVSCLDSKWEPKSTLVALQPTLDALGPLHPRNNIPDESILNSMERSGASSDFSSRLAYLERQKGPQVAWFLHAIGRLSSMCKSNDLYLDGKGLGQKRVRNPLTTNLSSADEITRDIPSCDVIEHPININSSSSFFPSTFCQFQHIMDVGGGRGDLGLAVALMFPHTIVTVVDINLTSLLAGLENAISIGIPNICFVLGDANIPGFFQSLQQLDLFQRFVDGNRRLWKDNLVGNDNFRTTHPLNSSSKVFIEEVIDSSSGLGVRVGETSDNVNRSSEQKQCDKESNTEPITDFHCTPDLFIGLHACGGLSDRITTLAAQHKAAFLVCTCCFNKHHSLAEPWNFNFCMGEESVESTADASLGLKGAFSTPERSKLCRVADYSAENREFAVAGMWAVNSLRLDHVKRNYRFKDSEQVESGEWKTEILLFPASFSPKNMLISGYYSTTKI